VVALCDRGPGEPHETDTTEQGGYGEAEAIASATGLDHDHIVIEGCDTQFHYGTSELEHASSVRINLDPTTSDSRSRSPATVSTADR